MTTNNTFALATQMGLKQDYAAMVAELFKHMGSDIATLMHAAVGVAGEAAELLEGIVEHRDLVGTGLEMHKPTENIPEELGDMRFYLQHILTTYGWEFDSFLLELSGDDYPDGVVERIVIHSGAVLDLVKKSWVYNKELDALALYDAVKLLLSAYLDMLAWFGFTDEQIQCVNQYKLRTGPKARFPLGYSDAAAIARADKVEGEVGCPDEGCPFYGNPHGHDASSVVKPA